MLNQFHKLLSRAAAGALPVLLSAFALSAGASAQAPPAVANTPVAIPHTGTFGNLWQGAISNRGDWVVYDFKTDSLYEFPANGGAEIVIAASGVIAGGFTDSGIAIDQRNNNIYLDDNYNGDLLEFPFDAATQSWDLPQQRVAYNLTGSVGSNGSCATYQPNGNFFQSAALAMNANGVLAVGTENSCGVAIFTVPIDASGNFGSATPIVSTMNARAKTLAIDNAGNISYSEDGQPNAMFIAAGVTGIPVEKGSSAVQRVDVGTLGTPMTNSSVQGVSVDGAGNIYIADSVIGTYEVPFQAGAPNVKGAVTLSTIPAASSGAAPAIDFARGILYYAITNTTTISDIAKLYLNRYEFGSSPAASTAVASGKVTYLFNSAATPYTFTIQQAGVTGVFTLGDLSGCGITFTADPTGMKMTENATLFAAGSTCTLPVTFTPAVVGKASATLLMQDMSGNVISSVILHGSGSGPDVAGFPDTESTFGAGLKTPSQIAVDYAGKTYVADSGLGKVLQYGTGATSTTMPVSLGTGLVAPTGVAVDGSGNVFIADSGKVLEIPFGPNGLVAAGQTTLKTGLGTNLLLAADSIGDVFVADVSNQTLVRLRTLLASAEEVDTPGFTQLSAIAADGAGDVFLGNGQNLIELSAAGRQTITNSLVNPTGLAVDHSGAVYVTSPTQTVRIPNVGGTLNAANQTLIATTATKPTSVAVDFAGNAYVTDAGGADVVFVSTNPSVNLGKLATTTSTSTGSVSIVNNGNLPLTITGFGSNADYSVTSNSCVGTAIAVGAACNATVTFNPGPGDQGTLQSQLAITGNEIDTPSNINVTGVGVTLATSNSAISVVKPTVTNATVGVTVTSASGSGPIPTGTATVVVTGLATGSTPITSTLPLKNGVASFPELTLQAGNLTFTVTYNGDRVYGRSTATTTTAVAVGMASIIQPAASTVPTYVLSEDGSAQEPYDSSSIPYDYTYPVSFVAANAAPLVGVPVIDATGAITQNYGQVTYAVSGGSPACTGSSAIVNVQADGTASFKTTCLAIDNSNTQIPHVMTSYTVTPTYTGANYAPVTGTPVTFIAIPNPMVIITSNPGTLSVASGSKASTTLTLTSLLGYGVTGVNSSLNRNYSLPVEMNCDALPAHATCSFSYPNPDPSDASSVDVTPTAPGTVIMTLNTNVNVGTTQASLKQGPGYFAAMLGLGLLGAAFGRRKTIQARLLTVMLVCCFSASVFSLAACSSANIAATPNLTTPKGTYTITVTAKQGGSKQVPNPTPGGAPLTIYGNGNQMSIPFTMNVTVQ